MNKELIYAEAFEAAGAEGLDEEACKEAADAAVFEWKEEQVRATVRKIRAATGGSYAQAYTFWVGGDCPGGISKYVKDLEADGYDTAGLWQDNAEWFARKGITREDYEIIKEASL